MGNDLSAFRDLTPEQSALLRHLEGVPAFTDHFYFTGGTLLKALGIVPRASNDLDFFTFPDAGELGFRSGLAAVKASLEAMFGGAGFDETDRGFVLHSYNTLIDCIYDVVPLIDRTVHFGSLRTVGLKDMAACKAGALCSRDEVKDYIDIAFLTKKEGWLLADLERLAEEKYRLGTVTEEKLLEELLHKRELFTIAPDRFLRDGNANIALVNEQIEFLIQNTSL